MTNELEKRFFDTFGIIPTPIYSELWADEWMAEEYPQISDHILLELICILSRHAKIGHYTMDGLKRQLLNLAIIHKKNILDQVRTLFEEG